MKTLSVKYQIRIKNALAFDFMHARAIFARFKITILKQMFYKIPSHLDFLCKTSYTTLAVPIRGDWASIQIASHHTFRKGTKRPNPSRDSWYRAWKIELKDNFRVEFLWFYDATSVKQIKEELLQTNILKDIITSEIILLLKL